MAKMKDLAIMLAEDYQKKHPKASWEESMEYVCGEDKSCILRRLRNTAKKERIMIKLFKNVDEKLAEIGFIKIRENEYGVVYTRKNEEYKYTHTVSILHKSSGRHILQSYDADLFDTKNIGNTCVGLTGYEMKLFLKKMRKIGLYSKKGENINEEITN